MKLGPIISATITTVAVFIVGCTVVQTSKPHATGTCTSALPSYNLPKTKLRARYQRVLVKATGELAPGKEGYEIKTEISAEQDVYCLDYLASALASDKIRIVSEAYKKDETTKIDPNRSGLLQIVTNISKDYTGIILKKIARTVFIGLSGAAGFEPAPSMLAGRALITPGDQEVSIFPIDIEFDPLDPVDLARANDRLNDVGLCIVLGRFSYDVESADVAHYCNDPKGTILRFPSKAPEITGKAKTFEVTKPGILYRPRRSYSIALFGKRDPESQGPWRLIEAKDARFENLSPIFSVGISRALFAERRTALIFDDGELQTYCTTKSSEAVAIAEIPVEVVNSLVALPAQILKVEIDTVTNKKKLADRQAMLLKLQDQLLRRELGLSDEPFNSTGASGTRAADDLGLESVNAPDISSAQPSEATSITGDGTLLKQLCSEAKDGDTDTL